jgi:Cof subfamily protein (haloacid dehalogenase superfamily)
MMPASNQPEQHWRLVISDLDGTLLDDNNQISPTNQAAVAYLAQLGIGFTIATGRIDRMARFYVRQLGITLPIIASNGAIIRDCQTDRILAQNNLPPIMAMALVHDLAAYKMDYLCYSADKIYYPAGSKRASLIMDRISRYTKSTNDQVALVPLEEQAETLTRTGLLKIGVSLPDPDARSKIQELMDRYPGLEYALSEKDSLQIMASDATKGQALLRLANILGIEPSSVIAFGDYDNDASMLATAGLGIAMANATPGARAASSLITETNHESGFAAAIQHLFGRPDSIAAE